MKKIIYIIMFLFAIISVFASEEQIFSNYVFSDESVVADDTAFIIRMDEYADSALVQYDNYYLSMDVGQCRIEGVYKVCFNETEYDLSKKKWKGLFKIFSLKPVIKITRTVSDLKTVMGEEIFFTIELENTGAKSVSNIKYEENFPIDVEFTDRGGLNQVGSALIWEGSIDEGKIKEFDYAVKFRQSFKGSLLSFVKFYDGTEEKTVYSNAASFDIDPALEVEGKFEDEDYEVPSSGINFNNDEDEVFIGDETLLVFSLVNNRVDNKSIDAKITFTFPETLQFAGSEAVTVWRNASSYYSAGSATLVKISDNRYVWEDKIVSDKLLVLKFIGKLVGVGAVTADIEYDFKDDLIKETKVFNIDIENQELFISTNIDDNEEFDSGQERIFRVWIQNPNEDMEFYGVNIRFNTTLFNESPYYIKKMGEFTSSRILEKRVLITPSTKDITTYFNVIAEYTTEFGERFTEKLERDIKIKAIKDVKITHSFSPSKAESGEEIEVKTKIQNDRNIDLPSVHVRDIVPIGFSVIGINDRFVDINKKDDITVYTYKIIAPLVSEDTKFDIETFVDYTESGVRYNYSESSTVTIEPTDLELKVSATYSTTDLAVGEVFDVGYTITNNEEELLKDIVIKFPTGRAFDLIGSTEYFITKLDPDESITLDGIARYAPKINDTQKLPEAYVFYESAIGAKYNSSASKRSFSKIKSGVVSIPSILVNKTINSSVFVGEEVEVTLYFKNVGNDNAVLNVSDAGKQWTLTLCEGCQSTLTYSLKKDEPGDYILTPAEVVVTSYGEVITTSSDEVELEVKELEVVEVVQVTPEENIIEEKVIEEEEEVEEVVETKEGESILVPLLVFVGLLGALMGTFYIVKAVKTSKVKPEEKEEEIPEEVKVKEGEINEVAGELERITGSEKDSKKKE